MKQLQNNFTTPEQSRRLLELGLPADSADCFTANPIERLQPIDELTKFVLYKDETYTQRINKICKFGDVKHSDYLPCWSVGRLIEIYNICLLEKSYHYYPRFGRYENMIGIMVDAFVFTQKELDFSKLEE